MRTRLLKLIGAAAVMMALMALLTPASVPVSAQAPTAAAKAGPAPKTSWGEPDLQGIWTDNYQVQLQRPARYANKEFFTDKERADIDQQRAGLQRREVRVQSGTEKDVAGAYNSVFQS